MSFFSLALNQLFAPNHWNDVPTYDKKLKKQREQAANMKAAIMDLLRDNPCPVLSREIGEKVGGNARQIGRLSTELIDAGKIERVLVRGISALKYIRG